MQEEKGRGGKFGAMKYKGEELELVYQNRDGDGNQLHVWKGKSLKNYPRYIADNDFVFYVQTSGLYRFSLEDQLKLEDLVLAIVVIPKRRREKAQLFIDAANKHIRDI